jgi:hypothetical protein
VAGLLFPIPPVVDNPPLAPARPRRPEIPPERLRITSPWAAVHAATPSFELPVELLSMRRPRAAEPSLRLAPRGQRFESALHVAPTVIAPYLKDVARAPFPSASEAVAGYPGGNAARTPYPGGA